MAFTEQYDVAVVGAGHTGCEAAMAAAGMGIVVSQVPKCEGVKCTDILYSLSPDILYTCFQPVKRRRALLESNLAEE
jgi:flavin-dependent dehydrogenase